MLGTLLVELGPRASRSARRQEKHRPLGIELARQAVHPTEAEGLFDNIAIRNVTRVALLPENEPDALTLGMVLFESAPPGGPAVDLDPLTIVAQGDLTSDPKMPDVLRQ